MYDKQFYKNQVNGSLSSAQNILTKLFELYKPSSLVDFGCGKGGWLKTAHDMGVSQVTGLEGPWVESKDLLSSSIELHTVDFRSGKYPTLPKFDMAMSLEVAEHFEEEFADGFVDALTSVSGVVLFGAAIPFQAGTHHVNLKFPSYWVEKFSSRGYQIFDVVRPAAWGDESVEAWYAQNTLLFVRDADVKKKLSKHFVSMPLDLVHPRMYLKKSQMLAKAQSTLKAEPIRDAALLLESENLELARALMNMAYFIKPQGGFIKKKLGEYNEKLKAQKRKRRIS